nr:reverse transcriptase domain-containing protein [Tanacetum cinerariifolium]
MNTASSSSGSLLSNTVPNPHEDLKAITTRSGVNLAGPSVSPSSSSKEEDREPETITDQILTGSTNNVPPLVVQPSPASTSFSTLSSFNMLEVTKDTVQPRGTFMQKTLEECNELIENMTAHHNHWDTSAIQDETSRNISSTSTTESSLLSNTVPNLHEDLKAITTRSGVNLAGPSVSPFSSSKEEDQEPETITDQILTGSTNNVPPLVVQPSPASTSFSTLSSFNMLEVTKDTKLPEKLGDPGKTERVLIDVYGEELTLRIDDEALTFKVGQTSKYSYNDAELINRIDVIDVACEEYVQEVLGFSDTSKSGNPTLISDPIIALSSPSLTPFEGGDFILEEIEACITSISIPPGIDDTDLDLEGDIRLLE